MRGLLQRLSEVDSEAEAALRVIATFDALIQHRASFGALARTTAGLVGCPVGILVLADEACIRVDGAGKSLDPCRPPSQAVDVVVAGETVASCWLERDGAPGIYDQIVLERLVIACASIWREHGGGTLSAAVEVAISAESAERARGAALRQLGLEPTTPVRVLAFSEVPYSGTSLDPALRALVQQALDHRTPARTTVMGQRGAALIEAHQPLPRPIEGMALGAGEIVRAMDAPTSWFQAHAILDLAMSVPLFFGPIADIANVGSLISLALVPQSQRTTNSEVRALQELARNHDEDLLCLEAFLATGSLRAAGRLLHRHHSSIASRLTRVAEALSVDLLSPLGTSRALTALILLRLHDLELPTPVE